MVVTLMMVVVVVVVVVLMMVIVVGSGDHIGPNDYVRFSGTRYFVCVFIFTQNIITYTCLVFFCTKRLRSLRIWSLISISQTFI